MRTFKIFILGIAIILICVMLFSSCGNGKALAPGLYDADGKLVASWDELVNTYGMNVSMPYSLDQVKISTVSPYYVLSNNDALSKGTHLVVGNIKTIGESSFAFCDQLTSITLLDSVKIIGINAFANCKNISSITILGAIHIAECAFTGCENLQSITIPESVTDIGDNAFSGCTSLTSITVDQNNSNYRSENSYLIYTEKSKNILVFGCGNTAIPDSITHIGSRVFMDYTTLTSVIIPDSVINIGEAAFACCANLTSITFEGTVEQWNAISFGYLWNIDVPATEVICSDGTVPLN